jgi:hypothetical protein
MSSASPGNLPPIPPPPPAALQALASPQQLRPRDPHDVRWYRPSFFEALRRMGWRLIFFAPALLMLGLLLMIPFHLWAIQILVIGWKLALLAVVLPSMYAVRSAMEVLKQRKEPFCIHCGYDLSGLPDDHTCPECGEYYNFAVIAEYKRDPAWFIQRYRMAHPPATAAMHTGTAKRDE